PPAPPRPPPGDCPPYFHAWSQSGKLDGNNRPPAGRGSGGVPQFLPPGGWVGRRTLRSPNRGTSRPEGQGGGLGTHSASAMNDLSESRDYVLQTCREHDVKFIRLWFTDILGSLKSVAITVEELPEALEEGVGFDGSSIEGFARIDESDMMAMPDPTTFAILPWRPAEP